MKMDFPQVDLPTEVLAWTNVTEDILNIYKQSCRLQACIVAICTEGSMKASINLLDYEIRPNDLITLLPGTIIQFRERTEKVCLCFVGFSAHCTGRVNLMKNIGNAYPKLLEQPVVPLSEDVAGYLKDYFALLSRASCNENFDMDPELVELSLQTILTSIRLIYHNYPGENSSSNRKKEICRELIQSITEHYKDERRAQFYADQLGISLQHLSTTVRQVTGKSVLDTIAYIVIMDAKAKLKGTNITIQIVYGHVATQVVVELTGGEGITINQLVSAMITPPVVGATMDLGTGVITPATAFGKADKMGINGLTAQYIMLPIRHSAPMTLTLEISADNENSTRTYTTQIPLPDGELKAGNSYLFKAVINGNSVTLASVNVKDWTDVDETGKPLYPTQN